MRNRLLICLLLLNSWCAAQSVSASGTIQASGNMTIGGVGTQSALQSITISPSNPIIPYNQSQTFTATGIYTSGPPQDVTGLAAWISSNSSVATNMGSGSVFQCVARGTVTISASYQSVTGTTTLGCQSPTFSPLGTQNVTQNSSPVTIVQYTGANGTQPFTFTASGLPVGWSLSSTGCPTSPVAQINCSLMGTPSTVGLFSFLIQATDSLGNVACPSPPYPMGGCPVAVNVVPAGSEAAENKYCTLVGLIETVTGLTDPGPANQLQTCNYTTIASTSLSSPSGVGTGTTIIVCSAPSFCEGSSQNFAVPNPSSPAAATVYCSPTSSTVVPWGTPTTCSSLSNGPFYTLAIQGAINFVAGSINSVSTGLGNLCGSWIQVSAQLSPTSQAVYLEPTVQAPVNINCGSDFGQPWIWLSTDQMNSAGVIGGGLTPGSRVTPAWVGQTSIVGRPNYNQPSPSGIYLPQWKCEQPPTGGCTHLQSNTGAIISGLRLMGINLTSGHGRESALDFYGNNVCPNNNNGTPDCSPGNLGPYLFLGCAAIGGTNCLSPVSGTVNTTNSSSGSCTANCVTWESWNSGVSGAEQYNFSMFNSPVAGVVVGNPVLINGVQYAVCTVYSNTLMSVTTYAQFQAQNNTCASPVGPGTQTGVTWTPYTGAYHVIVDRDLFVAGDDISTVTQYDTGTEAVKLRGGQHISVIDSYFLDFNCFYGNGPCVESHTIGDGTGEQSNDCGRKVVNNYLEASGENIFTGGGGSLGYPCDFEFRTNHLFKPLVWKVDNPLFPGQVSDAYLSSKNQTTAYIGPVSCILNPTNFVTVSSGCTAIVPTFAITNIVGNGTTATATCTPQCGVPHAAGWQPVISGNSNSGFNTTVTTVTTSGSPVTSFTFASSVNATGTGGTIAPGIITDVLTCVTAPCAASAPSGAGYGMCSKGNGNSYACNPTFSFTDNIGTFVSCGTQQVGFVNTNGTAVSWAGGQKFNKHLPGTQITINGVNYTVATWTNNTNIVLSTSAGSQSDVAYNTNFLTRGDCIYPMIGYYDTKNIGELKNVVRMLWEGNIHENSWVGQSDQNGNADIIGAKDANNLCPVCQTIDITKRYNYHRNTARGTSIAQTSATQCGDNQVCLSQNLERISDHDEVYDGMNGQYWTTGTSPISAFSGNCVEMDNADSQPGADNNILINHLTCIPSLPTSPVVQLSGGSMLSLNVSCNYAGNQTTPAVWEFITFENSIAAGGVKNQSAHSNGCPNCNNNACSDHSFTGSTVALNQVMSSSYLGTPGGGVYPGNILTGISKLSGQVNTSNGALGTCSSNCAQYVAGSGLQFISAMNGNLVTIAGTNYTATYIDANDISLSAPPSTQTNANYSTGAYSCSVAPTAATLSGGGPTIACGGTPNSSGIQGCIKLNTSGSALAQIYPSDVGAGYTSTPTITFNGTCTKPPVVEVQIGGQNNAGTSAWCFDSNAQPGKAWAGISNMEPPPAAQGDSASHNACAKPTGGGNLYTASGLTTWQTMGFVNYQVDSAGAECTGWPGITTSCATVPAGSSDLHLCAGANNPAGSSCTAASLGSGAANDGLDMGADMDLVIGCDGLNGCALGTPSAYTGIYISNGQLVIPQ